MRDVRKLLQGSDPVVHEPGLSAAELQAVRRVLLSALPETEPGAWWAAPVLLATTIGVALWIGIVLGTHLPPPKSTPVNTHTVEQRQIQFETPGGTRIIWVLNSDFEL